MSLRKKPEGSRIEDERYNGRGALYERRRSTGRTAGAHRSENAGISNEKKGENPFRRKPKVS